MRPLPIATWMNDWNTIIRDYIFTDSELKSLMMVPAHTNIIDFIDKYFVRAGYTNALLENEDVRIVYGDISSSETSVPNVKQNEMSFDIYVRLEHLHNVGRDRLQYRTQLIANRQVTILTNHGTSGKYIGGYRFWVKNELDLGTKTVGYARYCLTLNYMKVY